MNYLQSLFSVALPEVILISMACVILLVDAFVKKSSTRLVFLLTQLTLIAAFVITYKQFYDFTSLTTAFDGQYIYDKFSLFAKACIYLFSFFAFAYSSDYFAVRKKIKNEYYILGLLAVLGMSVMVSAFTLLTLYLGLELLSLPLYAMVAMNKDSTASTEAAMKYFVLGALASGILLYGMSLIYGLTGSLQLNDIATILQTKQNTVSMVALIFILTGVVFKLGAVPFHMWVPDVYEGAATPTTLFIASAPKVAAFVMVVRLLAQTMPSLQANWSHMLVAISILSMGFGNLLAIAQTNLKRMLAYSSIAHVGYTLLGILAGPYSTSGYAAALFYISTYVLVAAGAFAIISIMGDQGVELDRLEDYRGLNARSPWLAFMMLLLLFSMAGVPPTVGFFAKLGLLEALVQAKYIWLAALALVFAIIGAYYYLRVVMLMYFEEPTVENKDKPIVASAGLWAAISINGSAALVLGLLPSTLIDICRIAVW